jgi:hypothetical protein
MKRGSVPPPTASIHSRAAPARSPAPAADVAAEAVEAINAPITPLKQRHIPEFDGPNVDQPKSKRRKRADPD